MGNSDNSSFFSIQNDDWFIGNDPARGPWDADACHAGPVAGLIARSVEQLVPDRQLARLTIELIRPVPMDGFQITADIRRQGRMMTTAAASLSNREGKTCAIATSMHLITTEVGDLPSATVTTPNFDQAKRGNFPVLAAGHSRDSFLNHVEAAYPPGETNEPGPTTLWMRTPPLLEDETPTPFQKLCPLADCGNGLSRNLELSDATFLNLDLTVAIYRPPESDWLASDARSFWEPTGMGMSHATLFDRKGSVGTALQTLLVRRLKSD